MKKKILCTLCLCVLALSVFISNQSDAGSTTLNLTSDSYTLSQGKTLQLKINGVKAKKVKWKSSNKKVATVSKNGTVKAVKSGTATISGKYKGITFKTKITVKESNLDDNVLCEDKRIKISLKEIKKGKIYFTIENKSSENIEVFADIFELNGKSYKSSVSKEIQPGFKYNCKLELYDEDYNEVNYKFEKGKLKGSFKYYYTEYDSKTIKFSTEVK
jgi:hypothetical protein